jgi:hypothetical protein
MKSRLLLIIFLFISITSGVTAFVIQAEELSGNSVTAVSGTSVSTIDQVGGAVRSVAKQGDTLFVGRGPRLLAYDIQSTAQPAEIGKTAVLTREVGYMDISGNYLYAVLGGDIGVFDISNPVTPTLTHYLATTALAESIKVNGNYAYVVQTGEWDSGMQKYIGSGLYVYDISTPTSPTQVDYLSIEKGSRFNLDISGNYAYIAADYFSESVAKLIIVNISNPLNVQQVTEQSRGDELQNQAGITIDNNYLYVGGYDGGPSGLFIYSLVDPISPNLQSFHTGSFLPRGIAISGDYAFVAGSSGGLRAINISDPTMPADADVYNLNALFSAVDVTISGNTAYLAYFGLGLHAIDISNPAMLTATKTINPLGYATGVAFNGSAIFAIDQDSGLRVLDKTNQSELGYHPADKNSGNLTIVDDNLFASTVNPFGLQIFNVSNLTTPTPTAFYTATRPVNNYAISGNYAYLAIGGSGLEIVDLSNLGNPTQAGTFDDSIDYVNDVDVANNYAYLADGSNGLRVINVSNPAMPVQSGAINTIGYANLVKVKGQYAYVITGDETLHIVDISNPALPSSVTSQNVSTSFSVRTLSLNGDNLYIGLRERLLIFDISNPTSPTEILNLSLPNWPVQVIGDDIATYIADTSSGLLINLPLNLDEHMYLPMIIK